MSKYAETFAGLVGMIALGIIVIVLQRVPAKMGVQSIRGPFAIVVGVVTVIFSGVMLARLIRAHRRG